MSLQTVFGSFEAVGQTSESSAVILYQTVSPCNSGVSVCSLVYATTASNSHESSYACYYDEKRDTYLGDWYSVNWMEDSDVVREPSSVVSVVMLPVMFHVCHCYLWKYYYSSKHLVSDRRKQEVNLVNVPNSSLCLTSRITSFWFEAPVSGTETDQPDASCYLLDL